MTAQPGMVPADIALLTTIADPQLSPDGCYVAFVVTTLDVDANRYRCRIWLARTDGSEPPRPFTAGEARDVLPRWSPDGRVLAFVSHRDESGSQLYTLPADTAGELVRVAVWPEEIEQVAWSPQGDVIAFTARLRDESRYATSNDKDRPARRITRLTYRQDGTGWTHDRPRAVLVVDAAGTEAPRVLASGAADHGGVAWAPTADQLAFIAARHDSWDRDLAQDLFVMAARDGSEPVQLTPTDATFASPAWSPDGRLLAFVRTPLDHPSHGQVGVAAPDGTGQRLLTTALDRPCGGAQPPVWCGDELWWDVVDGGARHVYRMSTSAESAKPELVLGGTRVVTSFAVNSGHVAFVAASSTSPQELYVADRDGRGERRLTSFGSRLTSRARLSASQRFVAESADGAEVEAWLIPPADFDPARRYPVLLNVHGGPYIAYGDAVFDEFQIQAGAGFAVLFCNPRGSAGYSEDWARAVRSDGTVTDAGTGWGTADYLDLMAVVDEALRLFPFLDPDRLGVLGGSYGGYMTQWILSHTDRFRAGCAERGISNLLTLCSTSDLAPQTWCEYMGPSHLEAPEEYLRRSPITYADGITTPLLLVHSEQDLRCPVEQAEQMFVTLRLLDREVEFVRFPGEGHDLSRSGSPRHRIERAEIILDWFRRHLA